MNFYAVYRISNGNLISMGRGPAPTVGPAFGVVTFADQPDMTQVVWDTTALTFVARPPVQRPVLTPDEFWDRLTFAELVNIEQKKRENTAAGYRVAVAVDMLSRTEVLDVSRQRIQRLLQHFVNEGCITAARLTEITTPAVDA
jgi:hypothetical protein